LDRSALIFALIYNRVVGLVVMDETVHGRLNKENSYLLIFQFNFNLFAINSSLASPCQANLIDPVLTSRLIVRKTSPWWLSKTSTTELPE